MERQEGGECWGLQQAGAALVGVGEELEHLQHYFPHPPTCTT